MISKIGMALGAVLSIVMFALSPVHNDSMAVVNGVIGFLVMIICFIIWCSVRTDEDIEKEESNKYFKRIIVSDYAVVTMANCVIALYGDMRHCVLLYIFNLGIFLSFAMMFLSFGMYMLKLLIGETSSNVKFYIYTYYILTGIHVIFILSTPITKLYFYVDEMGIVQYPPTYFLAGIYSVLMLLLIFIWILRNGRSRQGKSILFSCVVAWGIGVICDTFTIVEDVGIFSDTMLGMLFAVGIIWIFCGIYSKQKHDFLKQKEELTSLRLNAMIAQIEPHFIFNTLGTIDSLCVEDPEHARTVIGMFSDYLRVNYHRTASHPMCSIEQEIENLKTYTQIEQIRFGRLNILYDVQETQFMIPSFTLQPLVENAIKHGICARKKSAGTVNVRTYSDNNDYIVLISDDGVGFDKESMKDGKMHVGIQNVEQRLRILCDGSLVIDSEIGKGTTCTIRVPKECKGVK